MLGYGPPLQRKESSSHRITAQRDSLNKSLPRLRVCVCILGYEPVYMLGYEPVCMLDYEPVCMLGYEPPRLFPRKESVHVRLRACPRGK